MVAGTITLDFPSVGATENIILAAALSNKVIYIKNAAMEPEIVDLQNYINKLGGSVSGAGTKDIKIVGVEKLEANIEYEIMPDRIEIGTLLCAAAITNGNITIKNVRIEHIIPIVYKLEEMGCEINLKEKEINLIANNRLKSCNLKTMPYPGFPTDMQPQIAVALALAKGSSMVTESIFENRFKYVDELNRMGAKIKVEGNTAYIEGVEHFTRRMSGAEVNVAIGLTRLGFPVEDLPRLGDDPFGHYIEQALKDNGIGTNLLTYDPVYRTGIQLKEYVKDGHDPAAPYYRKGSAASHLSIREIDALDLGEIGLVHVTGIPPALSKEAREATYRLMERARKAQIPVTFDPNLRPALWENDEMMRKVLNDLANYADVVLPGIGECEILAGTTDKEKAADFYHQKGAALVVIKDGKNGAYVSEKKENGEVVRDMIPGYPVKKVVDTVGAGDGFAVGVLSGLLKGLPVTECAKRGNAIGSLQVQHRGDNEWLPTEEILQSYMAGNIQK